MSVFDSLMGDMENDPLFGSHMRHMRQMSNMMNSLFSDPFGMMGPPPPAIGGDFESRALTRHGVHNPLMSPFPMSPLMNFNRLLSGSLGSLDHQMQPGGGAHQPTVGNYSSSSTLISMTSGPDGRPQVYKATSSTRLGPGGIKETQKTVTDSVTGTKKMSIGHHIGERAHIIEKEQNMHTGDREEREDLINIEDDEKEEFDSEWEAKARRREAAAAIEYGNYRLNGPSRSRHHGYHGGHSIPAITAGSSNRRHRERSSVTSLPIVAGRRSIRSPKLALPSSATSSSLAKTPYCPPNHHPHHDQPRKSKNVKTVSGSPNANI